MKEVITKARSYSIVFDYLRVAAMVGVIAVHLSQAFPIPIPSLKLVMHQGASCVQIFFVISAYLACGYFFSPGATTIVYYKKRALRILPAYYATIMMAMMYIEYTTQGYPEDIFRLGWLRYFLGLNTILPSMNFWQWNDAFGLWTMTDFIFFYAIMPFIIKKCYTFNRCVCLFFVSFILSLIAQWLSVYLETVSGFSEVKLMILWSPLVQLRYFFLGMLTFFAAREGKKSLALLIFVSLALLPVPFCSRDLLFAILTCILVVTVKDTDVAINGWKLSVLRFVSKYSFYVYLTHLLALAIGHRVAMSMFNSCSFAFYITKLLLFVFSTLLLCVFLEVIQSLSIRLFRSNATTQG